MGIRLRHDAAAVALPANTAQRKYGQQLVLQGQQQKYQATQAGYDRLFDAYRQGTQNQFTLNRDLQQNAFQTERDKRLNEFQKERDKANADRQQQAQQADRQQQMQMIQQRQDAERQQQFMDDARRQNSGMIMSDIQSGAYDPVTARKLQQNLVEESEALGNPNLDATQRAEALAKIRAERSTLTANRMQKPPQETMQERFNQSIVTDPNTGMRYRPNARGDFEPLEQPKQQPATAQEYYRQNPDKFQKDLDSTMNAMQSEVTAGTRKDPVTQEAAWEQMQESYNFRQKALGGSPTQGAGAQSQPSSPMQQQSSATAAYDAQMTGQGYKLITPNNGNPPYYYKDGNSVYFDADRTRSISGPASVMNAPSAPAPAPSAETTEPPMSMFGGTAPQEKVNIWAMPPDGMPPAGMAAKPDPGTPPAPTAAPQELTAALPERGAPPAPVQPAPMMAQRPDAGSPPVPYSSPAEPIPLAANSTSITPAATSPSRPQQVKVGGKPLVVTPGTLTPQETAARSQIMELPQEDRIMALMPYDPQFKGKTISQILDDPQTKAQYDELTKQGQTTGNYRQDILNHMDETLQHNVLNGAGQSKPDAYVGMNVNDITDPKAKAEVAKIPRPKNADEVKAIRGPYFIDPNGIIRSTQKQA